jgi:hypothetical protein
MRVLACVACCLLLASSLLPTKTLAQSPSNQAKARSSGEPSNAGHIAAVRPNTLKERLNARTIGLAAGRLEGEPIRFAAELARAMDDGDNMRVVPIVTRGVFDNVFDLLYLRGSARPGEGKKADLTEQPERAADTAAGERRFRELAGRRKLQSKP